MPRFFLTSGGQRLNGLAYAFLILLCLLSYVHGFTTLPPTDRDESSFAQATKQMIESGNYVDIRLQDAPRYKKPIGIYWLQAVSVKLFNPHHLDQIWAYRIPSLLGAVIAVVMTAALGVFLFGPTAGFIAALLLASCVLLNVEARLAKTDAVLLACTMLMQHAMARAYIKKNIKLRRFILFWTSLAVGLLVKGPIILLILASTLFWLWRTDKDISWLKSFKPAFGIPYTLLLTAPWFIAIMMQSHGDFIQQSAGNDMLAKLWQGQNRGMIPPGFYLALFPAMFFPGSLFALLAIPDTWKNRQSPAVRFCLAWTIPTWIVFELTMTKLLHYVLPVYPAIAMLAAKALYDGYPALGEARRWIAASATGLWLILGTGFALAFAVLPMIANESAELPQIAAGAVLIIAQGFCLLLLLRRKALASSVAIATGFLVFSTTVFSATLPSLQHVWLSRDAVTMANAKSACSNPRIISSAYGEPSLIFLGGTNTKITNDAAEAANYLKKGTCDVALIDGTHEPDFLAAYAPNKPIVAGQIEGLTGRGEKGTLTLYLPGNTP
jgi:4-amino-4-deoxy-L-arabinose transferase-like glycosyltransferase